jgi:leucyl-tRNA synthetase
LGHEQSVGQVSWPVYDDALIQADEILIVIQVNGKVRDKITVPTDASEEDIKSRSLGTSKIQEFIGEKEIRKVIVVPKKLVNIVVK